MPRCGSDPTPDSQGVAARFCEMRWIWDWVLLTVLVAGCSFSPDSVETAATSSSSEPPVSASTTTVRIQPIVVTVRLDTSGATLFGDALGAVYDEDGRRVAAFRIPSGWQRPADFDPDDPEQTYRAYERTGEPPLVEVELPVPGSYTFEVREFAVSASPCGTCEAGYSGSSVEVTVADGDQVLIDKGRPAWVS